jgi:hypothetical protein
MAVMAVPGSRDQVGKRCGREMDDAIRWGGKERVPW